MRTINPKCTNNNSLKCSILISLHYYQLNNHPERINQLNKYINKYNFKSNNYSDFENNNLYISLTVYDEYSQLLHKSNNQTNNNKATIIKINNHRYHAIEPDKNKYLQLKELLKQFTHKKLSEYIRSKIIY